MSAEHAEAFVAFFITAVPMIVSAAIYLAAEKVEKKINQRKKDKKI